MKGWHIFTHSVGMVIRNLPQAMQIALMPSLIGVAVGAALIMLTGFPVTEIMDERALGRWIDNNGAGAFIPFFLMLLVVALVVQLWVFVAWHRFVLLEEYPESWIPELRGANMLSYFGRGLLIGLVIFLAMLPIGLIVGILTTFLVQISAYAIFLSVLILPLCAYLMFFRFSAILPAAAIGEDLKLGQAWNATAGATGTLLLTGFSALVVQYLLNIVSGYSMALFLPLGIAFQVFVTLVFSLVNVSILTTIYGHYVQGRELS